MSAPSSEARGAAAPGLKRSVGLALLSLYGVGVMVGAGIYVLIGEVAAQAGAWTPVAFLLAGAAAALTAASFAELAARIPEAGGEAAYTRAAFGSATLSAGVGLAVCAVGVLSAGAVLQGGVGYLRALAPLPSEALILAVGLGLIATAAIGVIASLAFAAALTVIELVGLVLVVSVAFWAAPPAELVEPAGSTRAGPPLAGLAGAVFLAFFAFIGFEDMVNLAEETRDPVRTVPLAIGVAFALVTAIYVLVSVAALRMASPAALAESARPLALVYERATGGSAGFISAVGAAAALNGVLAQIVMAARVLFGLGRRTRALAWFGAAHPRFRTPARATLVVGGAVIGLALTLPLGALAAATSAVLLSVFVLMNGALIVLKLRGPSPAGAPDWPLWLPGLGAAASLLVLAGAAL